MNTEKFISFHFNEKYMMYQFSVNINTFSFN